MTRNEAILMGAKTYFTGIPCKHGHVCDRQVEYGHCVECRKIRARKRSKERAPNRKITEEQRERSRAYHRDWYARNREYMLADRAQKRIERKEHIRALDAAWRANNKHKLANKDRNRRARLRGAEGSHTAEELTALLEKQKGCCAYCRKNIRGNFHADHIQPLVKGGSNYIRNIQLLCQNCNLRKGAKEPERFARELGRLV